MTDQVQTSAPNGDTGQGDGIDANISKHLDIAIEAQDGKTETPPNNEPEKKEDAVVEQPEDRQSIASDDQSQPTDKQPKPDEAGTKTKTETAGPKDLKLADGTVVRGGAERRFYEQRETARQEAAHERAQKEEIVRRYQALETEYKAIKSSAESLHGMDPRAVSLGARIVKDMQSDPVGTLKKLLAETIAQGYTIEDIGAGIDTAAITRLIEERIPKQEAPGVTQEQIVADAEKEVSAFYSKFPDAQPHDALIARVLRDHPTLSLESVYFQLKNGFAEKGFDWSRSLEDNLKDASNLENGAGQPQKTEQKTLPNGRGSNEEEFKLNGSGVAHEDMDTSDIVRQAMRENGLNI